MISRLQTWAQERGWRIAFGNVGVLQQVREELRDRKTTGELDAGFYDNNLTFFRYKDSLHSAADAQAIMLVAVRRPAHRVFFEFEQGALEVMLPPTYLRYSNLFIEVRDDIEACIPELQGHLSILVAPLKRLACSLGLATYGRNNLTYIPGWGSYFQLLGYITDIDIGIPDDWAPQPLMLMRECEDCWNCRLACPTAAIEEDRILLHAESCATLFSEQPGHLNHTLAPGCLFGCLECQQVCPMNSGLLRIESAGVTFDRHETDLFLTGCDVDTRPQTLAHKLAILGLSEERLIGRNLAQLMQARTQ